MEKNNPMMPLIIKYLKGDITIQEKERLVSWLKETPENQRLFDRIREMKLVSDMNNPKLQFDYQTGFKRFLAATGSNEAIERISTSVKKHVVTLSYHWAAAVILLAIACGSLLYAGIHTLTGKQEVAHAYQEIKVPYGSRSSVTLPDGSEISLNAGTTLRYNVDFGKQKRDLWLDGEAYFVVSKSKTPFTVHSGDVQIKALGTEFNVRAYSSEDRIETTLVEGKVAVNKITEQEEQSQPVTLLPNQKLIIAKNTIPSDTDITDTYQNDSPEETLQSIPSKNNSLQMVKQENVNPVPDISWKDKEWVIYRETLGDLAAKFERRYDVTIFFQDESLKELRYNGTLPDESLEQVLRVMAMVSPIHYQVKGKNVIFTENKDFNITQKQP